MVHKNKKINNKLKNLKIKRLMFKVDVFRKGMASIYPQV